MIRKIVIAFVCFFSLSSMAGTCPKASPTNDVNFCASFRTAATCHCSESLPSMFCQDMKQLYSRMLSVFGTLEKACQYQRATSVQDCLDNWNCYLFGGIDSTGKLCNGTKSACEAMPK